MPYAWENCFSHETGVTILIEKLAVVISLQFYQIVHLQYLHVVQIFLRYYPQFACKAVFSSKWPVPLHCTPIVESHLWVLSLDPG